MTTAIALVDVNNFYSSCERLFRPDLVGRPIVVLSNNDGCVVARSAEAKKMGIKMAGPYFKIQREFERAGGVCFSSNYALYADMSQRVMSTLESMVPAIEVYSIDEAFIELGSLWAGDFVDFGHQIRATIQRYTGLTVGVGIGPTKTLAKLANYAAKKWPATGGVVDIRDEGRRARLMAITPIDEVWGIGRALNKQLQAQGVATVADLIAQPPKQIRQRYGVVVERVVQELRGIPCSELTIDTPAKQQIVSSRSFGERITEQDSMHQALSAFMERAAEKLRHEKMRCQHVSIFFRTSPFSEGEPYYGNQLSAKLPRPTDDTRELLHHVTQLLPHIWRDGFRYQKGGVILGSFTPRDHYQADLFDNPGSPDRRLMAVIDAINHSGLGHIGFASKGVDVSEWMMKREHLSPRYTTSWDDLPGAR